MKTIQGIAPGLTDTQRYVNLYESLTFEGTSEVALHSVVEVRDAAELMMIRLVRDLRARRWGWEDIGRELGMTRQGAQQFMKRNAHRI